MSVKGHKSVSASHAVTWGWEKGDLAVAVVESDGTALIPFHFALGVNPKSSEAIITVYGKRFRVTGWNQEKQAFVCEKVTDK